MSPFPAERVRSWPKAELHVHLEGTVDASTLLELARRHGIEPPARDEAGIDAWYHFRDFDQFLERYFFVISLLKNPDDFALVAERYLGTAHAQGVRHVEFHVSATGHILESGHRWVDIQEGIVVGCERAEARFGVSSLLIPDISPHLPASECARAMDEVLADRHPSVVAIGMGGPADHWWTDDFSPIYRAAAAEGLRLVAHAGEHGPAREVAFAIEEFGAERIQHGIGATGDAEVVAMLVERGIACDVCPGSNLALGAVRTPGEHPLSEMIDAGITVTLGSDDPPMFQTSLLDEYRRAWEWCDLDEAGLRELAANSLAASFAPRHRVESWCRELEGRVD